MPDLTSTQFLKPISFGSFQLQGPGYRTLFLEDALVEATPEVSTILSEIAHQFPVDVGRQPQERPVTLHVQIEGARSRTRPQALGLVEALYRAFDVLAAAPSYLVAHGPDGGRRRLSCRPERIIPMQGLPGMYVVRLMSAEALWESDEETGTQTAAATPHTWSVGVEGTARCFPTFRIKPTVAKANTADYLNRWQYSVAWRSEMRGVDSQGLGYPLDVADGLLDTATEVAAAPSRMQADGDDLRLLLDGREMRRDLSGMDGANTKVWSSLSLKPRIMLALRDAMTAGSPANGESFRISDPGGIPPGTPTTGWFMVDSEAIWYGDHDGADTFSDILRASRRTTAATHDAGTAIYRIQHDIQVVSNYTAATDPNADDDRKPVIDLANSSNLKHIYVGPFTPVPGTLRTGALLPKFTNDNLLSAAISMLDSGATVAFRDVAPSAAAPQFNNLELYVPCGVKAAAGAITHDVTVEDILALETYGVDLEGFEALLERYNSGNDGAAKTLTPASVLSRVRWVGNPQIVTGADTDDADDEEITTSALAQQFELDQATEIWHLLVRLKKVDAPDGNVEICIRSDLDGEPSTRTSPTFTIACADIGAAYADHIVHWSDGAGNFAVLPAGKFWLSLVRSAAGDNVYWSFSSSQLYAKGLFDGAAAGGASPEGPNSPDTGADDASVGTIAWADPGNVLASDDARATAAGIGENITTHYLKATDFDFSIPTDAEILGIIVEIEKVMTGTGSIIDSTVKLVKGGVVVGENKAKAGQEWPSGDDAYFQYGSPDDTWGQRWTPADINAANFGAVISAINVEAGASGANVDHIRITVYFGASRRQTAHFAILSRPQATLQVEAPSGSGHEVLLDDIEITFDDATPRTPKIVRGSQETIYFLRGVLRNDDTGQEIALACPMALNDILEIDCFHKTVKLYPYSDSEPVRDVPWAATFSDEVEWMRWDPGAVDMSYTEAGIGEVEVEATWRDAWA